MFSRMDALDLWTPLPRLSAALALIWLEHTGYVVTHTERLLHLHEQTLHADLLVLVGTRGREGTTRTETGGFSMCRGCSQRSSRVPRAG